MDYVKSEQERKPEMSVQDDYQTVRRSLFIGKAVAVGLARDHTCSEEVPFVIHHDFEVALHALIRLGARFGIEDEYPKCRAEMVSGTGMEGQTR